MPDKTTYTLIVHIDPKDLVTKTFPKSALGIANLSFPRDMNCVVTSKAVPPQCGHNSFAATALLRSSLSLHLLPHFSTWSHSLTYFLFYPCEKALMRLQKSFAIFLSAHFAKEYVLRNCVYFDASLRKDSFLLQFKSKYECRIHLGHSVFWKAAYDWWTTSQKGNRMALASRKDLMRILARAIHESGNTRYFQEFLFEHFFLSVWKS